MAASKAARARLPSLLLFWASGRGAGRAGRQPVGGAVFQRAPRRNFIDDAILKKLAELLIPPSQESVDGEFLRRRIWFPLAFSPWKGGAFLTDPRAGNALR